LRAAADRCAAERFLADERACLANADRDAALRPSRFSAPLTARDRVGAAAA
jgi:hypothetical protein